MAVKPPSEPPLPGTFLQTLFNDTLDAGVIRELDPIDIQEFSQFSFLGTATKLGVGSVLIVMRFNFTTTSGELRSGGSCTFGEFSPGVFEINSCSYTTELNTDSVFNAAGPLIVISLENPSSSGISVDVLLKAFFRR